jgi:aquaporin Z
VLGGLAAGAVLYLIASGVSGFDASAGFATNGCGDASPQHYSMEAGAICEIVMTFMFLMVILGVTLQGAPGGFAPLAIGLALTLIHLISIPVTNTSVNPARSMGVAFFQGGAAVEQLWFVWVIPLIGGGLAGIAQRWLGQK